MSHICLLEIVNAIGVQMISPANSAVKAMVLEMRPTITESPCAGSVPPHRGTLMRWIAKVSMDGARTCFQVAGHGDMQGLDSLSQAHVLIRAAAFKIGWTPVSRKLGISFPESFSCHCHAACVAKRALRPSEVNCACVRIPQLTL